jgi:CBS domain-containing protein
MTALDTTMLGTVADWMTHEPVTVPEEAPLSRVLRLMRDREIRHVLVMQGERLAGIFSSRDVRRLLGGDAGAPSDVAVAALMTENPVTVSPSAPLLEAAREILDRKIGALPVTEGGRPVGILTSQDALEALLAWAEKTR